MRTVSKISNLHQVGEVANLVKNISSGQCEVSFRLSINKVWHSIKHAEQGSEPEAVLCNYAIENGRAAVLATLGGKFKTESIMVCNDGAMPPGKLAVGDRVLESELNKLGNTTFFKYHADRCRLYEQRYVVKAKRRIVHGVICQTEFKSKLWTVIDKW